MSRPEPRTPGEPLELWAGPECAVLGSGDDTLHDPLELTGFSRRIEADLERLAALGIKRVRLPLLWRRISPQAGQPGDWREADRAVQRLRELGIAPIACLMHAGGCPPGMDVLDPGFAAGLAAHARAVAERYPDITLFTPVNAPLTSARRSMLEGLWPPHRRSDAGFVRAVLQQVQATVLAMRAVRGATPTAALLQTEDLGLTQSALRLRYQAEFMNLRRWLCLDLLAGRVDRSHRMWRYLRKHGASEAELMALVAAPCAPDMIGLELDIASDRFLDDRLNLYPREQWDGNGRHRYMDLPAVQVQGEPIGGFEARLREAWQRYGRPLVVSNAAVAGPREAQMRWLHAAWQAARALRSQGADVRAVTAWAAFGTHDGSGGRRYRPGLWDVRAPEPRPTALAAMVRGLAGEGGFAHPVLEGPGEWQRENRFVHPPHGLVRSLPVNGRPLLITGALGMLGSAFVQLCEQRGLAHVALDHEQLDITEPAAIDAALAQWQPWALINAAGSARVDAAEHDPRLSRCIAQGPPLLAAACARAGVRFVTFSCDQVFDGAKRAPYVESDAPQPLNAYGRAQREAEHGVLAADAGALLVRSAALFGPWDTGNTVARMVAALRQRRRFAAAMDQTVSPTYVPDLVHAVLDLLTDGARGLLHLAHCGAVTWADFLRLAAEAAGLDESLIDPVPAQALGLSAPRPPVVALATERWDVMPTLEEGIAGFVRDVGRAALLPLAGQAPVTGRTRRRQSAGGSPAAEAMHARR